MNDIRCIDADALLTDRMKSKYYHLPNGDIAIPIIDIEHAPTIEPEREKGTPLLEKREWIEGYENRWYRKKFYCASCGIKIKIESWDGKRCFGEGTILQDNNMPNFCPNCGADMRGEPDETD